MELNLDFIIKRFLDVRTWVTACIGSTAIEAVFRLAPKFNLSRIDFPMMNGTLIFPPGPRAKVAGGVMYFFGAVALVTVFRAIHKRTRLPLCAKGILFGNMLFLFSSLFAFPLLGIVNPQMQKGNVPKPGFFGLKLKGWRTAASNYLGHVVFGLALGLAEKLWSGTRSPIKETT
jgi:uncharacterized membrane protein YagU involved in acid resistance